MTVALAPQLAGLAWASPRALTAPGAGAVQRPGWNGAQDAAGGRGGCPSRDRQAWSWPRVLVCAFCWGHETQARPDWSRKRTRCAWTRRGDAAGSHLRRQATVRFRNGAFALRPAISSQLHADLLPTFLPLSCSV